MNHVRGEINGLAIGRPIRSQRKNGVKVFGPSVTRVLAGKLLGGRLHRANFLRDSRRDPLVEEHAIFFGRACCRHENGNSCGNATGNIGGSVYGNAAPYPLLYPVSYPPMYPLPYPVPDAGCPCEKAARL